MRVQEEPAKTRGNIKMLVFVTQGDVRVPMIVVAMSKDGSKVLRPDDGTWGDYFQSMECQNNIRDNKPSRHISVATVWPSVATSSPEVKKKVWTVEEIFGKKKTPEPETKIKLKLVDFRALMTVPAPLPPAPKPMHVPVHREKRAEDGPATSPNKIFTGRRHHK